jgi:simple sugar transport system permease protein
VIVAAPVLLAICISMVVIQLTGRPSAQALRALLQGALGGRVAIARTISYILPLTFVALGWIVAFTSRRINVGFEGQIVVGGTAAAVIGLYVHGLPRPLHLLLASTVGTLAGAGYAGIGAWLWARRGVNEIISTLLLNFIALQFLGWLVVGPLKEPHVIFPRSSPLAPSARWPSVLSNTALTWNIVLVPVVVIAVWFLLRRTSFGFALRVTGANPELARHLGLPTEKINVLALLIAGGIAGLAGGSLVLSAETSRLMDGFSSGFGFDGIVVALVAWNSPLGTVPAAFLFAILRSGGGLMESLTGVPLELVLITQGLVIILVSSTTFLLENVRKQAKPFRFPARRKRAAEVERVG